MKLSCSNCNSEINSEDINIQTDLAKCATCGSILKASELLPSLVQVSAQPPVGSSINIERGFNRDITFSIPKKGFQLILIPQLIFSIIWLGFISFWTYFALKGSIFFALFSIPFWLVGITMVVGIFNQIYERQTLRLDKKKISFSKIRPIRSKHFETSLVNVQAVKLVPIKINSFNVGNNFSQLSRVRGGITSLLAPAIITSKKTQHFFESLNEAEQDWVVQTINKEIRKNG